MKKILALTLALAMSACLLVGCQSAPASTGSGASASTPSSAAGDQATAEPEEATINVIYHPTIGGSTAIATAITQGFFEEQNLNVNLQMYTSGPPEVAAMVANQAEFGFIGSGAAWLAFSGQVDIIALDNLALTEQIIARTGIGSIADLKGKTIAVQEGAAGYTLLLVALQENGLTVNDVKIMNISNDNIPSTYNDNSIDAWAVWKPAATSLLEALGDGGAVLADNQTYPEYAFPSTWIANKDYIAEHPDVAQRFVTALTKAQIYRAENPDQACAYASTYAQQATNELTAQLPDVVFPTAEQFKEYYTTDSFVTMLTNLRATQEENVEGDLAIEDIYEDTFAKAAVEELVP